MNSQTGLAITDLDHIQQSIADILKTRIGSRLMQPEYGSELFGLTDIPLNSAGKLRFYAATAIALSRWEKRITVLRVELEITEGKAEINIYSLLNLTGDLIEIRGITL